MKLKLDTAFYFSILGQPPYPAMKRRHYPTQAFSLVELLVVITVIGIIAAFAVPALNNLMKSSKMAESANVLIDQISFSRQNAVSKNKMIEVRFYRFADPEQPGELATDKTTWQFRAIQTFEVADSGIPVPMGEYKRLPDGIIMNPDSELSSLLTLTDGVFTDPDKNLDPELPRGVKHDYEYSFLRFYPDGSTNKSPSGRWFVTVHSLADKASTSPAAPPPNFFTLQVDPVNGSTKTFRPGL